MNLERLIPIPWWWLIAPPARITASMTAVHAAL